jgi:DNA-binding NarL/FixJ family response regulator
LKNTEVLILSAHYSDQLVREIIDAGALGYVLKTDADHDLLIAVESLARHKPFFTSKTAKLIQNEFPTGRIGKRFILTSFLELVLTLLDASFYMRVGSSSGS